MTKTITQWTLVFFTALALAFSLSTMAFAESDDIDDLDDDSSMEDDSNDDDESEDNDDSSDENEDESDDQDESEDDSDDEMDDDKERLCDKEHRGDNKGECLMRHIKKCKDLRDDEERDRKFCRDGEWKERREARMSDIVDGFIEAKDLSDEESAAIRKEVEALIRQLITLLLSNRGL